MKLVFRSSFSNFDNFKLQSSSMLLSVSNEKIQQSFAFGPQLPWLTKVANESLIKFHYKLRTCCCLKNNSLVNQILLINGREGIFEMRTKFFSCTGGQSWTPAATNYQTWMTKNFGVKILSSWWMLFLIRVRNPVFLINEIYLEKTAWNRIRLHDEENKREPLRTKPVSEFLTETPSSKQVLHFLDSCRQKIGTAYKKIIVQLNKRTILNIECYYLFNEDVVSCKCSWNHGQKRLNNFR